MGTVGGFELVVCGVRSVQREECVVLGVSRVRSECWECAVQECAV